MRQPCPWPSVPPPPPTPRWSPSSTACLALESEHRHLDPVVLAAGVATALADPDRAHYILAEEAGEVVGQVMLTREWSDWRNGWIWWLQSVYVRADFRRRGVFRLLFEHVEERIGRDPTVLGLRLYVEHENKVAQETYAHLGMDESGLLGAGEDAEIKLDFLPSPLGGEGLEVRGGNTQESNYIHSPHPQPLSPGAGERGCEQPED